MEFSPVCSSARDHYKLQTLYPGAGKSWDTELVLARAWPMISKRDCHDPHVHQSLLPSGPVEALTKNPEGPFDPETPNGKKPGGGGAF